MVLAFTVVVKYGVVYVEVPVFEKYVFVFVAQYVANVRVSVIVVDDNILNKVTMPV